MWTNPDQQAWPPWGGGREGNFSGCNRGAFCSATDTFLFRDLTCRLWFISRLRTYQAGVLCSKQPWPAFIWYRTSELSELPSASLPGSTCHSISTPCDSPTTRVHRSTCSQSTDMECFVCKYDYRTLETWIFRSSTPQTIHVVLSTNTCIESECGPEESNPREMGQRRLPWPHRLHYQYSRPLLVYITCVHMYYYYY